MAAAVPTRGTKPVLQSVLLKGGVLTGSDGEIRIDVTLEDAPPGCDFLLPEDRFSAIVGSCTADEITLTPSDNCEIGRASCRERV